MILKIYCTDIAKVVEKLKTTNDELTRERYKFDVPGRRSDVNFAKLSKAEVDEFEQILKLGAEKQQKYYASNYRALLEWKSLAQDSSGDQPIKKLDLLVTGIKAFMESAPHRWVFHQDSDGSMNPYFLKEAKYTKGYTDRSSGVWIPPVVSMKIVGYRRGSETSKNFHYYSENLKTVREMFAEDNILIETEEAVKKYLETFQRYVKLQALVGVQMEAFGDARFSGRYHSELVAMVREGVATKVVLDDAGDDDDERSSKATYTTDTFWQDIPNRNGMADLHYDEDEAEIIAERDGEPNRVELPVHPYLKVFDLQKHEWGTIHSANLKDYEWDKTLGDKLILNEDEKGLIDVLMSQTNKRIEDIIRGKMRGTIILATGRPGVGKTLTAEVFSEMIEKPLYNVQCSQLGIEVEQVEKRLEVVLNRASRWGAILLIDEADVYIRARGEEIQQNAIVGVFLRLIEYYRGVLFMASNRGEMVDDAIISRATAWIKYELPDEDQLADIWRVLGAQYEAKLAKKDIATLIEKLPKISGRTVRNLLKLARMIAGDKAISVENILRASKYQALN